MWKNNHSQDMKRSRVPYCKIFPRSALCAGIIGWLVSASATSATTEKFVVRGELNFRADLRENHFGASASHDLRAAPVANDNFFLYSRITLGAAWNMTSQFSLETDFRDSRTREDNRRPSPLNNDADLYQAFLRYQFEGGEIKVGRQNIGLGDGLIFGIPNFNSGRTFDGLHFRHLGQEWEFGGLAVKPVTLQDNQWDRADAHVWTAGFYANRNSGTRRHHFYAFWKETGTASPQQAGGIGVLGVQSQGKLADHWQYTAHLSWQAGSVEGSTDRHDHRSYYLQASLLREFSGV